ncbi:krev interaction trapped protein 1-like [Ruditapes philippinarum]|uniref:krev interaction trapped protein 1-like n=1 Tax=Ruditapes philippinarum TaxID=129788 RepID=UPI00295ADEB0|nr:krev interaction trapped protein 1-like [Ruditapes philippinarum]
MEVILAVVRPKQNVSGQDYRAKLYDILLLDHKNVDRHGKQKYFPSFHLTVEKEPRDLILSHLYTITGGDHVGIKGERALIVPWTKDGQRSSLSRFTLYCIPISPRDKLNSVFVDKSPNSPGFYSLETLLHSLNSSMNFPPPTKTCVMQIDKWLKEKHSKPGALELVFRSRADFRVKFTVSNPAFLPISMGLSDSTGSSSTLYLRTLMSDFPEEIRIAANEYSAKMMAIEKCTKVVMNPLFGTNLVPGNRPLRTVPCPPPDYIKSVTNSRKSSLNSSIDPDSYSLEERELYPVHMFAAKGDVSKVRDCISRHYQLAMRDPYGWTPIHFAAWFGYEEIVQMLLNAGCSPNVLNSDDRTPLHLSAIKGYPAVVKVLLNHPELDINLVDKKGRTAFEMCEQKFSLEHKEVAKCLVKAARQPRQIQVLTMDGNSISLNLIDGANTTVQQLNQQMLKEFNMPEIPYADIFTIWICSPSLELQLKPEHKPLEHMSSWQYKIVGNLTDGDPTQEEPHLKWRRNAKISLIVERVVDHPHAVRLLFHEAKQNYINAFYPCKEPDVLLFGSILLYLSHSSDQQSARSFVSTHRNLQQLVPQPNLKSKSNWGNRIYHKYRDLCAKDQPLRTQVLQLEFLNNCRNLTVYGSAFFTGDLQTGNPRQQGKCFIAVNDVGIHIINFQSRVMLHSYKYSEINWILPNEYGMLELNVVRSVPRQGDRHNSLNPLKLRTKQAGTINHLMKKLSRITYGIMTRPLSVE